MARFRTKPIEVNAVQVWKTNLKNVCEFLGGEKRRNLDFSINYSSGRVGVLPVEGRSGSVAFPSDWLIRNPQGDVIAVTDAVLKARYERIG